MLKCRLKTVATSYLSFYVTPCSHQIYSKNYEHDTSSLGFNFEWFSQMPIYAEKIYSAKTMSQNIMSTTEHASDWIMYQTLLNIPKPVWQKTLVSRRWMLFVNCHLGQSCHNILDVTTSERPYTNVVWYSVAAAVTNLATVTPGCSTLWRTVLFCKSCVSSLEVIRRCPHGFSSRRRRRCYSLDTHATAAWISS